MKAIGKYLIEKESLGKGQFGQVFKCHSRENPGDVYAVKIIQKKALNPRLFNNLKNEINILAKIESKHVIKLHDIQRTENNFYLIMELCNGSDLEKLKEARGKFTELEARIILQQLVSGFKEIYKQKVMHRDLKLANILVNFPGKDFNFKDVKPDQKSKIMKDVLKKMDLIANNIEVKIADLGFARELSYEDLSQTMCGTPLVMAPEVLNGKMYNHKADVWSLGIVFFEMITGFTPFTGRDKNDLKRNLEAGVYKLPKKLKLSLQGLDFLNCCLQFEQEYRMSWDELVRHPYITTDPRTEKAEDELHLSYSVEHGQYMKEDLETHENPLSLLNEKNAILLNCKDPKKFNEIYEKVIERHFKNQVGNMQPVFEGNQDNQNLDKLAQSMDQQNLDQDSDDEKFFDLEEAKFKAQDEPIFMMKDEEIKHRDEDLVFIQQQQKPAVNIDQSKRQSHEKAKESQQMDLIRALQQQNDIVEFNSNKNDCKDLIDIEEINRKRMLLEQQQQQQQQQHVEPAQDAYQDDQIAQIMKSQAAAVAKQDEQDDGFDKKFEEVKPDDVKSDSEKGAHLNGQYYPDEDPIDVAKDSIYPNLRVHGHPQQPQVEFFDQNPFLQKSINIHDNYFQ